MAKVEDRERELRAVLKEWLSNRLESRADRFAWSQYNEILNEIGEKVLAESIRLGEDEDQFCMRMADAYDILSATKWILSPVESIQLEEKDLDEDDQKELEKKLHIVWFRKNPKKALYDGYSSEHMINFDQQELWEQVAAYMERPWLHRTLLEWIFVDAMIYREVCQFADSIKQDLLPGKRDIPGINDTYFEAKGDLRKMGKLNLKRNLEKLCWKLALGIGAPTTLIWWLSKKGVNDTAFIVGAIWVLLLCVCVALKIGRAIYRKATGWKSREQKALELWSQMAAVYDLLKGPIINPTMLKEELLKTKKAGAIWDTPVYSLIDRIIARDPAGWVISDRYTFNPNKCRGSRASTLPLPAVKPSVGMSGDLAG